MNAVTSLHNLWRKFGATDLLVSPLGLGTVKIGRNESVKYPTQFAIPGDKQVRNLLALAFDLGINLIDTAPAYGCSENRLGKLLTNRANWLIISKIGEEFVAGKSAFDFSAKHARFSLERSLKRLQTDVIDILLIHSDGDDAAIFHNENLWQQLAQFKQEGKIRAFGLSGKQPTYQTKALPKSDCAMSCYNLDYHEEKCVLDAAYQLNKGILLKKALASGHANNIEQSFAHAFSHPAVNSVIVGTINHQHLQNNVQIVSDLLINQQSNHKH